MVNTSDRISDVRLQYLITHYLNVEWPELCSGLMSVSPKMWLDRMNELLKALSVERAKVEELKEKLRALE